MALCKRCGREYKQKRFWQSNCSRKCQLESYYIKKVSEIKKSSVKKILTTFFILSIFSSTTEASTASWYSYKSCIKEGTSGVFTASGERFDENAMTCALPHRNFGGLYKVTNIKNGKSVVVRHTDFGPGRKPRSRGVVVDLSKGAFQKIGTLRDGIIPVRVEAI